MHWVELLKQRREACGLTQTELAVQAGVSLPSIQKMEAGRANPSLKTLESVFNVIGVDVQFQLKSESVNAVQNEQISTENKAEALPKAEKKAKASSLLDTVTQELTGLTKGPARDRVTHFFRLIDKIASERRPN